MMKLTIGTALAAAVVVALYAGKTDIRRLYWMYHL